LELPNPLVSIVIPVYNKELWITETLRSVFNQNYENWECIIVNDGSTDESLNRIVGFVDSHPAKWRVVTIANSGQTFARNYGIKLSNGDYVSFLDADDLWHPNKLIAQIEQFLENPGLELSLTPYIIFSENQRKGFRIVKKSNPEKLVNDWLSMRGFGGLIESTGMLKRSTLVDFDYFEGQLSMTAGLDLCLRVVRSKPSIITTQPYVYYRLSKGQFHENENVLVSDLIITTSVHTNSLEILNRLKVNHANYLYWSENRSLGRFKFVKSILHAFLIFDFSKLAMLYSLISRNIVAIFRGVWRQRAIRLFLQNHRVEP
jgi:glycosyltransferase involved in cell wall biosynthesis